MSHLQIVERAARRLAFLAVRIDRDDLLPRCHGAGNVLLAKRAHHPATEQRLLVLRIDRERHPELGDRPVGLVRVVVTDAKIGADVWIPAIQCQGIFVPLDRFLVPLCIEVQVAKLHARLHVVRIALGNVLERRDLAFVQDWPGCLRRSNGAACVTPRLRRRAGQVPAVCR